MKSGERFHKFLEKVRFLKAAKRGLHSPIWWPDFIQAEIQEKANICFAFSWGGEVNSIKCSNDGATQIIEKYPWLSPFRCELARAIEKY